MEHVYEWRDDLETVINSRKLSDALGNPSTQRKCYYNPIWQITLYNTDKNNTTHFWKIKEKKHIGYYIKHTTQIRRLITNLTKPGTFILL